MCGIIGYIGKKNTSNILVEGLKRLEYRGYDSAGVAILSDGKIKTEKAVGKIVNLESKLLGKDQIKGNIGIAHTRWATHGEPVEKNAHPHLSCGGDFAVVHNGIIENYQDLREILTKKGHKFNSETDSEVLVHLIEENYKGNLKDAVIESLKIIEGTYGIAVISDKEPEKIIVARHGSPLIIGVGNDENFVASDVSAILGYTSKVIYLNDGEIAVLTKDNFELTNVANEILESEINEIEWSLEESEKGGYEHFMLKEIMEQPDVIRNSSRGRLLIEEGTVRLGGIERHKEVLRDIERIMIVACGTARYAGLVGEYMLEEYAGIPVEVEFASEFRYRSPIVDEKTLVIAISQSGETADTLAAIREAKRKGAVTMGIVNAVGSTIARETDFGVYNHAGPEISVASTKAFSSQLTVLMLLTVFLGRQRNMSLGEGQRITAEMATLPALIEKVLEKSDEVKILAKKYAKYTNFMYLGRKYNFPLAEEGALKLKEISYIHAEGFAAGEMKHGSIALIDENFPVFAILPQDSVYEKNISNIEEIRARKGKILAVATEGDKKIESVATDVIYVPKASELTYPLVIVPILQMFAYFVTCEKGFDVDKPRNLAKSVTVE